MSQPPQTPLTVTADRIRQALKGSGRHALVQAAGECADGFAQAGTWLAELEGRLAAVESRPSAGAPADASAGSPGGLDFDQTTAALQAWARRPVTIRLGTAGAAAPSLVRISGTLTVSVLGDGGRAYLGLDGTDFSLVVAADDFRSGSRADQDGGVSLVLGPLQVLVAAAEPAG